MSDTGCIAGKRRLMASRAQRPSYTERTGSGSSQRSNSSASSMGAPSKQPFLVLLPLNDTFEPKCIQLFGLPDMVRIGRQTNKSTLPSRDNGFFDSKVLSRSHAEVWADVRGRVCIKDVKSSNGTFVNGVRLSKENEESEARELRPGDTLELGIDILNDETGTIVHRKVSARVDFAGIPQDSQSLQGLNSIREGGSERAYGETRIASRNHGIPGQSTAEYNQASAHPVTEPQHPLATFGKQSITFEMVVKKLANDLQVSKRVSADLKSTSDTFSRAAAHRLSRASTSPFRASVASNETASLSAQLARTKQALDAQAARVTTLEAMLEQEREARFAAEARWEASSLTAERLFEHDEKDVESMSDITVQANESESLLQKIATLSAQLADSERLHAQERERANLAERKQKEAENTIETLTAQLKEVEASRSALAQRLADASQGRAPDGQAKRGDRPSTHLTMRSGGGTALMSALGVVVLGLLVMGFLNEYAVKDAS